MDKARKTARSFRLDKEVLKIISRLAEEWHVSQAQVVEMLAREADEEQKELRVVRRKANRQLPQNLEN